MRPVVAVAIMSLVFNITLTVMKFCGSSRWTALVLRGSEIPRYAFTITVLLLFLRDHPCRWVLFQTGRAGCIDFCLFRQYRLRVRSGAQFVLPIPIRWITGMPADASKKRWSVCSMRCVLFRRNVPEKFR